MKHIFHLVFKSDLTHIKDIETISFKDIFMDINADIAQFSNWLDKATLSEPSDPNAMYLATKDKTGQPNIRVVLMKDFGRDGFTFYTNFKSAKGRELCENPNACLYFHWRTIRKSVKIRGMVELVDQKTADAYFHSRDRGSQIGAWASKQSRPLNGKAYLVSKAVFFALKFAFRPIPRPSYWGGFRLVPTKISFNELAMDTIELPLL